MQPARLGALVWYFVPTALLVLLVLAPPSSAQQQAVLETPQQANDRIHLMSASARLIPHDYVIGNGDLLDIEVFDVKELSREVRVSQSGSIGIPLVPVRLHVSGLTEVQAEQKIAEVLEANGLVSHAEVSISVKERKSKPITVVGAVEHAMVYQADRPVTLLEVLAEAGGVSNERRRYRDCEPARTGVVLRSNGASGNWSRRSRCLQRIDPPWPDAGTRLFHVSSHDCLREFSSAC